MPNFGLALPSGHTLVSVAERPEAWAPMEALDASVWPEFMKCDPVANRHWDSLRTQFAAFQLALLDAAGEVVACQNAAPLAWDGTDEGLPAGWDDQFERSVADAAAGASPTSLGAIQIVVRPALQGTGLAVLMLAAMRANALAHGLRSVIACVRPTGKHRYPLTPIERYARWTREDGLPFDPWIRIHARAGGRIVRASPHSMTIPGSVAEWETWTGLALPESGAYILPTATSPLFVDREAGTAVHHDENVWMVHDLA